MNFKFRSSCKISYTGQTDIGIQRNENQDHYGQFPENSLDPYYKAGLLFIVADGMGGHMNGSEASRMAVDIVSKEYYKNTKSEAADSLANAVQCANKAIYNKAISNSDARQMGTTVSALAIVGDKAVMAHVGDSRIYLIRDDKLIQLTSDHTKVGELQRAGLINEKEAKNHPQKSVLHRALGVKERVRVDISDDISLHPSDIFILCTDGLASVSNEELQTIATENTPQDACRKFIDIANERGGYDNSTVQVIKLEGGPIRFKPGRRLKRDISSTQLAWIILFGVFLIFLFITIYITNSYRALNAAPVEVSYEQEVDYEKEIPGLLQKGREYLNRDDLDQAIQVYQQILIINPLDMDALAGLDKIAERFIISGRRLQQLGNRNGALDYYYRALEIRPHDKQLSLIIKQREFN